MSFDEFKGKIGFKNIQGNDPHDNKTSEEILKNVKGILKLFKSE